MKRVVYITLLLFVGLSTSLKAQDRPTPASAEELGKLIFKAVKTNDHKLYQSLIIDEEECKSFIMGSELPEDKKKEMAQMMPMMIKDMVYNKSEEKLNKLQEDAKTKYEINWKKAKIDKVEVNEEVEGGATTADIKVLFSYKGNKFYLKTRDAMKPGSWRVSGGVRLGKITTTE